MTRKEKEYDLMMPIYISTPRAAVAFNAPMTNRLPGDLNHYDASHVRAQ